MAGDERRAAGRGGLGGDHPEGLREDGRHDGGVGERKQVDEVPVLERPGEEHPLVVLLGQPLELVAVVAEPDDHRAGVEAVERLEQQVDALVLDQLPEVDDRRGVGGEERREARRVALIGEPLLPVSGVRAGHGGPRRAGPRERRAARPGG